MFNRIIVGLDRSPMDRRVIEYTAFLCYYLKPERLYFLNVQPDLDIPDHVRETLDSFEQPEDEYIREELDRLIQLCFPDVSAYNPEIDVVEGSPRREVLRWTHIKNADLLVVGRKSTLPGRGLLPQQVARNASCSVMFVPEEAPLSIRKIWVPIDFSTHSERAMEVANHFLRFDDDAEIFPHHVYHLPSGYSKLGKSRSEFAEAIEAHIRKEYRQFCQKTACPNQEPRLTFDLEREGSAELTYREAKDQDADLIVVGARGKAALTAFFLGSFAERLTQLDLDIPLLIAKRKNKTFSISEMLEEI